MYFNGTSSPTSLLLFPVPVRVYLGVCVQEVFQQAFSLFLPKNFFKFERVRTFCSECTPEHLWAIHSNHFPLPRHWTRDRDFGLATATLDSRPRLWTRDRDFGLATRDMGPATRDPRLLLKLLILTRSSQSIKISIDLSIDKWIKIGKSDLINIDCIDQSVEIDDTLVSFIDLCWFLPILSIYTGKYISSSVQQKMKTEFMQTVNLLLIVEGSNNYPRFFF